jgi:hypothetical protein
MSPKVAPYCLYHLFLCRPTVSVSYRRRNARMVWFQHEHIMLNPTIRASVRLRLEGQLCLELDDAGGVVSTHTAEDTRRVDG